MTGVVALAGIGRQGHLARLHEVMATRRWGRTIAHLLEMLVAMYTGMAFIGPQVDGFAAAFGVPDLASRQPAAATILMALEMTLPMVLWMNHRGHSPRSIAEMTAAMVAPALVVIVAVPGDPMSVYHPAMLMAMVGVVAARGGDHPH